MICISCRAAGRANAGQDYRNAIILHANCKGDCGCQHKTGQGIIVRAGSKVPLMQTQSP